MAKRALDIIGALGGLLFITPFTPFIAFFIFAEDGFPIFVKLKRVSKEKVIRVYKFRTMVKGAEKMKRNLAHLNERKDGPFFKLKNDPRVTKVGRILRKFKLDEFPQFLNVLKGEISLVGPRPHEPEEVERYPPEFEELKTAKAGLTGLSQISGASGLPFRRELELDLYYLRNRTLRLDFKIFAKTVWIFFTDPSGV